VAQLTEIEPVTIRPGAVLSLCPGYIRVSRRERFEINGGSAGCLTEGMHDGLARQDRLSPRWKEWIISSASLLHVVDKFPQLDPSRRRLLASFD